MSFKISCFIFSITLVFISNCLIDVSITNAALIQMLEYVGIQLVTEIDTLHIYFPTAARHYNCHWTETAQRWKVFPFNYPLTVWNFFQRSGFALWLVNRNGYKWRCSGSRRLFCLLPTFMSRIFKFSGAKFLWEV